MATGGPCLEVLKFGYVQFRSKHLKSFRKRWLVLYGGTWTAPRLVKYTDEKHAAHNPDGRHVYDINDVISAERPPGKDYAVHVRFSSEERGIYFCSDSDAGANEWVQCIQKAMSGNTDMFCADLFQATHVDAPRDITIRVADGHVTIIKSGGIIMFQIPLTTIRKYQMDKDNVFWIETGRSSPIGEGFLYFRSSLTRYILTRIHEQATHGTLNRRQSLPTHSGPSSQAYIGHDPLRGRGEMRRPSLPANPGQQHLYDPRSSQAANYLKDYDPQDFAPPSHPAPPPPDRSPLPQAYTPFPSRCDTQEEYPRVPTSPSLGTINEIGQSAGNSERGHGYDPTFGTGRSSSQSFSGVQRKNSGSKLVAASRTRSLPTRPERKAYMSMQTSVRKAKTGTNVKTDDDLEYTDMNSRDGHGQPDSRDDYLTPTHKRHDERFRSDNRNS